MSKLYITLFLSAATLVVQAQIDPPCGIAGAYLCDNFDAYTAGDAVGPGASWWTTWSGTEGGAEDGIVSDAYAFSGTNSMLISGGVADVVLKLGNQSTGVWRLEWMCYLPDSATGYYNIQESEVPGMAWNLEVLYGLYDYAIPAPSGEGAIRVPVAENFNYPVATWFKVEHLIDLDNNSFQVIIDSVTVLEYDYPGNIGGVDFYAIDFNTEMYIDDVLLIDNCASFSGTTTVTNAQIGFTNGAVDLSVVSGTAPFTYAWSNGATTQDISGLAPGSYSVTITDATGCTTSATAVVAEVCGPLPGITTTGVTSTTASFDWIDEGVAFYRVQYRPSTGGAWTNINTPVSNITLTGLTPATTYKLKVSHTCPSGMKYSKSKNFATPARLDGTEDVTVPMITPNPGNGLFNITGLNADTQVRVYDLSGKQIAASADVHAGILDLTQAAEGVYVVHILENNMLISIEKLVIVR